MIPLLEPHENIRDIVDTYYCPNSDEYPTGKWFPVPTLIRTWLIFCVHGNAKILLGDKEFVPPKIALKGPFDHPYLFGYPQSKVCAILSQFSITGFYELTGIDSFTIKNTYPDAYTIWDKEVLDEVNRELEMYEEENERKEIIDKFFIDQKNKNTSYEISEKSTIVTKALAYTQREKYTVTLSEISSQVGVSSKTLERAFKSVTGLTPKKFLSGCLFEELCREMMIKKNKRVSEIMNSPFYDFSHINKWFSKYSNLPPSTFSQQEYHLLEDIMKHQNQF